MAKSKEKGLSDQEYIAKLPSHKEKDLWEKPVEMETSESGTDWNNIDLERGVERDKNILEPYSFETLLLEINCNLPEINEDTVVKQFFKELNAKNIQAFHIFQSNLDNIVKYAQKERD